jgi:hypothetical protein
VKTALVMGRLGVSRDEANAKLDEVKGRIGALIPDLQRG